MEQELAFWKSLIRLIPVFSLTLLLVAGCSFNTYVFDGHRGGGASGVVPSGMAQITFVSSELSAISSLLIAPFVVYMMDKSDEIEKSRMTKDLFTGSMFLPEPCSHKAGMHVYRMFENELSLLSYPRLLFVDNLGKFGRVFNEAVGKEGNVGIFRARLIEEGGAIGADAVLSGVIYRYKERIGEAYGVEEPASVAFSAFVLSVPDAKILFGATFDKTQKELLSNVTDVGYYMKGGLTWWKVERLARFGVEDIVGMLKSKFRNK